MKKLFIISIAIVLLLVGFICYQNIDNILPTNPPSIENPNDSQKPSIDDNTQGGDISTDISISFDENSQFIYF